MVIDKVPWQYEVVEKRLSWLKTIFLIAMLCRLTFAMLAQLSNAQWILCEIEYRWQFCIVSIDDVLVYSCSSSDHLKNLGAVFEWLSAAGAAIKLSQRATKIIACLKYTASPDGSRPGFEKLKAQSGGKFPLQQSAMMWGRKSFVGLQ